MNITELQAQKVLCGNYSFSQLGFSMLITRLKSVYAKNPTQTTLQNCAKEINVFLGKFKAIMAQDFAIISKI